MIILGICAILIWFIYWGCSYLNVTWDKNYPLYYSSKSIYINGETLPKFSFKQFKKFYNLNPDSWEIFNKDGIFPCPAKYNSKTYSMGCGFYGMERHYTPIFFTNIFEYRKYRKWAKKLWKKSYINANNKEINENTKKVIELVQQDIDEVRKNYEKTLSETEDTLAKVLKNLRIDASKHYYVNDKKEIVAVTFYDGVEGKGTATVTIPYDENGNIRYSELN